MEDATMKGDSKGSQNSDESSEAQEERADKADEFYCAQCHENGLKVSSWRDFSAWMEYVDGKITDTQLAEKAKTEIAQFSKDFGKYLVIEKNDTKLAEEEEEKRKKAKKANKIYREVCAEAGLTVCFFHGFASWSDYVEGKIGEQEFYKRARAEIKQMVLESQ